MQTFEITDEYVTLGQALKWAGIIGTGGEARELLSATRITVNGERDERRGRKLYPGDIVEVPGEEPIQIATETPEEPEPVIVAKASATISTPGRRVVKRIVRSGGRPVVQRRTP